MQKLHKRKNTENVQNSYLWKTTRKIAEWHIHCALPCSLYLLDEFNASCFCQQLEPVTFRSSPLAFTMAWVAPKVVSREFPPLLPQPGRVSENAWGRAVKSPPPHLVAALTPGCILCFKALPTWVREEAHLPRISNFCLISLSWSAFPYYLVPPYRNSLM